MGVNYSAIWQINLSDSDPISFERTYAIDTENRDDAFRDMAFKFDTSDKW